MIIVYYISRRSILHEYSVLASLELHDTAGWIGNKIHIACFVFEWLMLSTIDNKSSYKRADLPHVYHDFVTDVYFSSAIKFESQD